MEPQSKKLLIFGLIFIAICLIGAIRILRKGVREANLLAYDEKYYWLKNEIRNAEVTEPEYERLLLKLEFLAGMRHKNKEKTSVLRYEFEYKFRKIIKGKSVA